MNKDPCYGLVDTFRQHIDEALIIAIARDYDLEDPSGYEAARTTLDTLVSDAVDAPDFNPSGIPEGLDCEPSSNAASTASATDVHDPDDSSMESSTSPSDAPSPFQPVTSFDDSSDEVKFEHLRAMFTGLKEHDVRFALRKSNGDYQAALDYLLNVQFLQWSGEQVKGIDAFAHPDAGQARRKKGKKKKGTITARAPANEGTRIEEPGKQEDQTNRLAELLDIPQSEVLTVFHKTGGSLGATAIKLLELYKEIGIVIQGDAGANRAQSLARSYQNVPADYMPTIVQVTHPHADFAEELARLVNNHLTKPSRLQKLDVNYNLTPLPSEELAGSSVSPSQHSIRAGQEPKAMTYLSAVHAADRHAQASRVARNNASELFRRNGSLSRQAAGYYAQVARDQSFRARQAAAVTADHLVDHQSTRYTIDLHGVTVQDGVRIACHRVWKWWDELGDLKSERIREQGGFTIITGLGRHSAGGVSQLRQAVAAMLVQDGWKITVDTGKFVISGRR